ncbi:hypothetical protein DNTS_007219 [Danionella cerebrum]|uniref:Uncharacterized protein n=1 Tax=Danionella cerebrum TaxID=2873325 RepID=A0A553PIS8_9TELE|nr:hypothetical protein DNTS_007219 [Danionella translucida]
MLGIPRAVYQSTSRMRRATKTCPENEKPTDPESQLTPRRSSIMISALLLYLLAAGFIAVLAYCLYVLHVHQKYDHIPGPPRDNFLLGHTPSFSRSMQSEGLIHDQLLQWAEDYGPVYRLNSFHYAVIVVHCPEATKKILMSPSYLKDPLVYKQLFNLFGKRFLGNGLITAMDHDIWYRQRRIMDPAFSSS